MDRWTAAAARVEQTWPGSCMSTAVGTQSAKSEGRLFPGVRETSLFPGPSVDMPIWRRVQKKKLQLGTGPGPGMTWLSMGVDARSLSLSLVLVSRSHPLSRRDG